MKSCLWLLVALVSQIALAEKFVFDSSGRAGMAGRGGMDGRGDGGAGQPGADAARGEGGRPIRLWVRSVRGSATRVELEIEGYGTRQVDLSKVDVVQIRSNGGDGGVGGRGGNGGLGRDGRNGHDCTFFSSSAGNGENGGRGGDGAPGGRGADGGDAGPIEVHVDRSETYLLAKLHLEAKGGNSGGAGLGGTGGRGGKGGRGGSTVFIDYDGNLKSCLGGWSGSDGSSGNSVSTGSESGRPGRDGDVVVRVHDGSRHLDYSGVYRLEIEGMDLREEQPDGVFEPGESLALESLTLRNRGLMPAPAGVPLILSDLGGALLFPEGRALSLSADLEPQESRRYVFDKEKKTVVVAQDSRSTARALLGGTPLDVPRGFEIAVSSPIRVGGLPSAVSLSPLAPRRNLEIVIENLSRRAFGDEGRPLKLRFPTPTGAGAGFLTVKVSGHAVSWGEEILIDIPAGGSRTLSLELSFSQALAQSLSLSWYPQVLIENLSHGGWIQAARPEINVTFDEARATKAFAYEADVLGHHVWVTYGNGNRYQVKRIWATRVQGGSAVVLRYQLDKWMSSSSPNYSATLEEVSSSLDAFASNKPLTEEQVVDLIGSVIQKKASGSWAILSCR